MRIVFSIICCLALTAADSSINEQWTSFKISHGKKYSSVDEEKFRFSIFKENMKEIDEHNAKFSKGEVAYSMRINHFGDLTLGEFARIFTGYKKNTPTTKSNISQKFTYSPNTNLPDSIDWRSEGAVTPVKNQGTCSGCWSFSATGALEGQLFRNTGKLVALSEQQLIDCSRDYGNQGCEGGTMESAFQYLNEAGGIMSEDTYPFLGKDGVCIFSKNSMVNGSRVVFYVELSEGDEEALKEAVATVGPVAVAVKSSNNKFRFYEKGILNDGGCGPELNHAVLVVGYGKDSDMDYWIVKNSWSSQWGENGYIRIARNQGNACGVASYTSYPILQKTTNGGITTATPPPAEPLTSTRKPIPSKAWNTFLSSGHLILSSLFFIYFSIKF